MARPPLPRYRAEVTLVVEVSAEDTDHATQRVEALTDLTRHRLEATVRGARIGGSRLVTTTTSPAREA